MKYKLLLLGTNMAVINDIFLRMEDEFELQTSSLHFNDIKSHMKYFQPHAVIYCLHNESLDSIAKIVSIKNRSLGRRVPYVIIGNQEDCDDFNRQAVNIASLVLVKPLTAAAICGQVTAFLEHLYAEEESVEMDIWGNSIQSEAKNLKQVPETQNVPEAQKAVGETSEKKQTAAANGETTDEKKTILVVDDDIRMVKVIRRYLVANYTVASAVSGQVALRYLTRKKVDLILLDYMMPGMDGPQVLQALRAQPGTQNIPVVFLTGASEREKIQKALSLKPQGYLLKPINGDKLLAKIRELIG